MKRAHEEVKVPGDEQGALSVSAAGFTMIGLLAGLIAVFVAFAPAS